MTQDVVELQKQLDGALRQNEELTKQLNALKASANNAGDEDTSLKYQLELASMQVQFDAGVSACEDLKHERDVHIGALSSITKSEQELQVKYNNMTSQLQKENEECMRKFEESIKQRNQLQSRLRKADADLLKQQTDSENMKAHLQSVIAKYDQLGRQQQALQQQRDAAVERCEYFINQHHRLRPNRYDANAQGTEDEEGVCESAESPWQGTYQPEDVMALAKRNVTGTDVEGFGTLKSCASGKEKFLLQQLIDIWNLRLECIMHGLVAPVDFQTLVPEIGMTKRAWTKMKQEVRMRVGLPCQFRNRPRRKLQGGPTQNQCRGNKGGCQPDVQDDGEDDNVSQWSMPPTPMYNGNQQYPEYPLMQPQALTNQQLQPPIFRTCDGELDKVIKRENFQKGAAGACPIPIPRFLQEHSPQAAQSHALAQIFP